MGYRPISFIVGPHLQDIDHVGSLVDAVDQSMLAVDATGIRASQFADEFFIGRRVLPRIFFTMRLVKWRTRRFSAYLVPKSAIRTNTSSISVTSDISTWLKLSFKRINCLCCAES